MEELSEDARKLVELAISPPATVACTKECIPKRISLMAAARRLYGWSNEQLAELWEEIGDSL
jgi:hypothetical protein